MPKIGKMPNAREVTQKKQHWTGFTIPSILGVGGAPMHVNQRLKMFQPKSAAGEKLWEEGHPFVPLVKGRRRRVKTKVWKTMGVPACIFDPALILSFSSPSSHPPPHTITTKQNNGSSIFAPPSTFIFKHFVLLLRLLPQLSTDHIPVRNICFGIRAPNKELSSSHNNLIFEMSPKFWPSSGFLDLSISQWWL